MEQIHKITLLSDLTPPSLERTWLSAPHPTLPLLATCSADKTVRVYSLTNFRLLSTISGGHKRSVRSAAWKPNTKENVLATGSFDATVGIWRNDEQEDEDEGDGQDRDPEEGWAFSVLLDGHDSEVKSVSWSSSGSLLATCSRDKSIWIWEDLEDGDNNFETVAVMQEHGGDVKCVSWHPVEECLASGSYDDTIRLWREDVDDWGQVACLRGHAGTVWCVDWEGEGGGSTTTTTIPAGGNSSQISAWKEKHARSARLVSCSDDRTVRIWRRQPKDHHQQYRPSDVPSIIRPTGLEEHWDEEAVLPTAHDLSIYTVAWSKASGRIASVGADGRIVVYEEQFTTSSDDPLQTTWTVIDSLPGAHGIYEINHVAWAKRADRGKQADEEVLITTADDGSVKVWLV
ncbi:hypothetical protein ASPZODRAFT_128007 [Penicilliopsis zonata CBS 506.65]|uniref:Probable cytosolic iron-sulfur protein assembly protein 1 n=1 Tax=Penicilliopsis zonata CBS 506.65 TaxID=1073090 RepID=A0A1L9SR29_9EURO|nr:hypothetical protein ASPZODRAFT_128007 [Penicilliopsis zonata CBS 506.65]OJJ49531.1 hypothetical protein ASPZODRAFT_128007 [Penicilliopsis zonata CBS 506.65]